MMKFLRIYNAILQIIFYHAIVFFLKRNFIFATDFLKDVYKTDILPNCHLNN